LTIRMSFQNNLIFSSLISLDICSNENNLFMYVQQISKKLKLYQHILNQ